MPPERVHVKDVGFTADPPAGRSDYSPQVGQVSLSSTAGAKADAIFLYNPQLTNRAPLAQRGCHPGNVSHNGSLVLLLKSQQMIPAY